LLTLPYFIAFSFFCTPQSVKYLENLCFHPPCHHPPSEAAFARFGLAATVSMPLLLQQRWDVIRAGLECGLWISLGYFTQALALSTIDSGQCAFICSLTVVFVPVAAALLYGKPIRPYNVIAAMVALAGVGVLEGMFNINQLLGIAPAVAAAHSSTEAVIHGLQQPSLVANSVAEVSMGPLTALASSFGINKGDILALGQPIGFGTAFLRIEHYQEQFKDVPNRVLTIAAAQCVAVGILAFFWVLYDFHGSIPNFSYMIEPHRIAAIGWTGVVTTVVAIFIEGIALQTASATDASLAFSTEPVWASLFGFILLHETLGINSYVGGALILSACLIGAISDLRLSRKIDSSTGIVALAEPDDLRKP
jgi:drug/metabolite transporter (DMT)-like permease